MKLANNTAGGNRDLTEVAPKYESLSPSVRCVAAAPLCTPILDVYMDSCAPGGPRLSPAGHPGPEGGRWGARVSTRGGRHFLASAQG